MDFARRTKPLRIFLVGSALGLTACTQSFSPNEPAPAAPSYERLIGQLESEGTLSLQDAGAFAHFVPGDVITVRYRLTANDGRRERSVGEGDVLRVEVSDRPDLSLPRVVVQTDGQVSLPLLGRVQAAGGTIDQLSKRVGFLYRLLDVRTPSIDISLVSAGPDSFRAASETVEEVAVSNDLQIVLPLIDPVAANRAPEAVWREIRLAYRDQFGEKVEVAVGRSRLAPRSVYVVGKVNRVGKVPLRPGMSARMAITAAGGLRAAADSRNLILMRFMPDKRFEYGTFALNDAGNAPRNRIGLLPNDVVVVPDAQGRASTASIADAANRALPVALRRELGMFAPLISQSEPNTRNLSCVPDLEARNGNLGNALAVQLRSPVLSQNYVWTMQEHFESQKYLEAEQLVAVSLSLREEVFGPTDLAVAQSLNTLGLTYDVQGRHSDAAAMYTRALLIQEELLGSSHPYVASTIENLASVFVAECRYVEARSLHQRVLAIRESVQGPGHPDLARSLATYADFEEQVAAVEANDAGNGSARNRRR